MRESCALVIGFRRKWGIRNRRLADLVLRRGKVLGGSLSGPFFDNLPRRGKVGRMVRSGRRLYMTYVGDAGGIPSAAQEPYRIGRRIRKIPRPVSGVVET